MTAISAFFGGGAVLAIALAVDLGRFAALLDHLLQDFGDERIVVRGSAAGARLDIAVLDRGLDEAERRRGFLVAAFHGGDGRSLDVVADHRLVSGRKRPALAAEFQA